MHKNSKVNVKQDLIPEDEKLRIQNSLPPEVKGQLRCFVAVTVDQIKWQVDNHPKDIQVCLQWWGETGDGTMFWPSRARKKSSSFHASSSTVLFPVCSGSNQFAAYLKDMNVLVLDVLHSKSLKPFGRVEIHDMKEFSSSNPIDEWYPVTSRSVQPVIFADLHVALKFQSVEVGGREVKTLTPVVDGGSRHPVDKINDKHEDTKENFTVENGDTQRNEEDVDENDVISSLIKRGKTLRISMIESGAVLEDERKTVYEEVDPIEEKQLERSVSGSLFKEILKFDEEEDTMLSQPDISFPIVPCDDDIDLLYESRSSVGSESDDPIRDETLLQDLFYVAKDDSALSTLNESTQTKNDMKICDPKPMDEKECTEEKSASFVKSEPLEAVKGKSEPVLADIIVNRDPISFSENKLPPLDRRNSKDFLTELGVNKLTVLGRVTAAKVHINKLNTYDELKTDKRHKRTYFIEYEFPVAADYGCGQPEKNDIGLEITRIATKKTNAQSILFNHHSVFPVHFDSSVLKFWHDCALRINIFERKSGEKSPTVIGYGKTDLVTVLTSPHLQHEEMVQIRVYNKQDKDGRSSQSSSSSDAPLLGELEMKINLMSNGKNLDYFSPEKQNVSSEVGGHVKNVKHNVFPEMKDPHKIETEQIAPQVHINRNKEAIDHRHSVPLTTLLWVSEGRDIIESGHGIRVCVPGSITRSNFYLISRMFWTTDTSRSSISWGQKDPKFNFRQIFPVLLTSALLDRMHNNFLTLEVWNKAGGTQEDQLVGIAKLPLQHLYLSYKEEKTAKALLKSKFPAVAVDGWININNPFKGSSHGELHVLLSMGSENQINRLLEVKQYSGVDDHSRERFQNDFNLSSKHSEEKHVEHWFEVSVQNVRKLSAFEKTSLAETDCFVQYNFPYQKPDVEVNVDLSQDVPGLQSHRTATTVCVPDTKFNDMARYRIVLPPTLPVQRFLLAAYHGSWSGMSTAAAVTFELWKRYYYPNIRDQLIAKAVLPLSKLCGMITMQKPGETSIQSFSLPLTTLPNPTENRKSQSGGLLDIIIKYRQSQLALPHTHQVNENKADMNSHVCLAIEVIRACGLKCAFSELAKKDRNLTYPSEVGGNPFVKIKLPFNIKMNERATRTIAKTFTPEFGYRMEFVLPLVLRDNIIGRDSLEFSGTLAECLEFGEVVFEIWHQRLQENYETVVEEIPVGQDFCQRKLTPSSDVLLGVVKIPLQQLLFSHTGIRGWFPVSSRTLGWSTEDDTRNSLEKTVGGLEVVINLSESTAREKIIECGRAVGWCPPLWYELEDGAWLNDTVDNGAMNVGQGLSFVVSIKKVWIPKKVIAAEQTRQGVKSSEQIGCYIRYKFYDTKAVFSSIGGGKKIKASNSILCDLKHRHSYMVKTSSPFIWYIREERLEIQVWLTASRDDRSALPHKRDKLLGSAFIPLFPLLDGSKNFSQISGLYPLFRTGAVDLYGAGLHIQLLLQKPSLSNQTVEGEVDEDIVSTETSQGARHDSLTIESSDEEGRRKDVRNCGPKEISSPSDDDYNVITAHVVIEQALHLSFVKAHENIRIQPNVYVTYQPTTSVKLIKTKTIHSSSAPVWDHEKIVKFNKAMISKQILSFKVWHNRGESGKSDMSDELLGVASVDLSPLASGFRQVMGWYNIVDITGQCQGQIKVGVVPLLSVSPEGVLFPQVSYKQITAAGRKEDVLGGQTLDGLSIQPSGVPFDAAVPTLSSVEVPDSSKSFLLRQLRQNLNDLDVIKDKLSQRLGNNHMSSLCIKERSTDWPKPSEKSDDQDQELELENSLSCLASSPVNDALLEREKDVPVFHDKMLGDDAHQKPLVHRVAKDDSPVRRISVDSTESIDSNVNDNDRYGKLDIHYPLNDVHDVNIDELKSDVMHPTCDNDSNERTGVGAANLIYDVDDDSGKSDHIADSVLNPAKFINHIIHEHISDNLPVVSYNEDVGKKENHTEILVSDNAFGDESFGPTNALHESHQETSSFDHAHNYSDVDYPVETNDESLDSFFDCVTLKQRSELIKSPDLNEVVQPNSVITRKNLSKVRNTVEKRMIEDEHEQHLHEPQTSNHKPSINHSETIPCIKSSSVSHVNAVKKTDMNQEQPPKLTFQEKNECRTSPTSIPNFFMPPKDLEQSLRSVRLAATFRKQPIRQDNENERKDHDMADHKTVCTKGKLLTKSFVDFKKMQEIRSTGEVPLTSEQTSRLARIFSSNYCAKK